MPKRILIIEPYDSLAQLFREALQDAGYDVTLGTYEDVTAQLLERERFDCLFINLDQHRRPGLPNGLALAELADSLGVPVVMIPDDAAAEKKIREKGWLRLTKPFSPTALENLIERATQQADHTHPAQHA
jgi:DNA-binding NtrC family response regulator